MAVHVRGGWAVAAACAHRGHVPRGHAPPSTSSDACAASFVSSMSPSTSAITCSNSDAGQRRSSVESNHVNLLNKADVCILPMSGYTL